MLCLQVEEFFVELFLDDLFLDEAQFVLVFSCCFLDFVDFRFEVEDESGEEVFLSVYDDLSFILGFKFLSWEGLGSLEEEVVRCGNQEVLGQIEGEQVCWEIGEDKEVEFGSRWDIREEVEGSLESEVEVGEVDEKEGEVGGN